MRELLVPVPEACRLVGIGRSYFYKEIAGKRLRLIKLGRRTLVSVDDIRALVRELGGHVE